MRTPKAIRGANIPMQQSVPPMPPVKPYEGVDNLPKFEVTENCLYRPVGKHGLVIEANVVLTREEFVACYNKWIKDPYDEEYDRMKRSILDKYGIQDESLGGEYGNKPLPVSSYEELCKSIPDSGVEAFENSVKEAIEFRTKMEKTN